MKVTLAMGHFCDIHGPCVIMCTDRVEELPEFPPTTFNVPVCEACRSIELDTAYSCQDKNCYYVSTRTSMISDKARLLKDVVLRSLSVEVVQEDGRKTGTMYFGDCKRGHIISHVFDIKDSFARGFKRKYCIVVVGKHQIPLLNHYEFIEKILQQISEKLQEKADNINAIEQIETSEKEVRFSNSSKPTLRSLSKLVGEQFVFAHLHMWFVFILRAEIYNNIPQNVSECPVDCPSTKDLRELQRHMPHHVFEVLLYCTLTGIKIEEENLEIMTHFRQLLPKEFILPTTGEICRISKTGNIWDIHFMRNLPKTLPQLHILVQNALKNQYMCDAALPFYLMSHIMRWLNISCVLSWAPIQCDDLMRTLEVHNYDMPLLSYWISQSNTCVKLCETDWFDKFGNDSID